LNFLITDTFTASISRLANDEQKVVKTTAFDLQMNPANPGHQFHRIDKSKDANFWSVRASSDIRLIVHKTESSLLLCYAGHHDDAYRWAENRKIETHPKTGAAQIVQVRETVREVIVNQYTTGKLDTKPKPKLFADLEENLLLSYGIPMEWIKDVKDADEDSLLSLADFLPSEAAEALLELAIGGKPEPIVSKEPIASPFDHPDAQRRFRVVSNSEELAEALDYPWDKWAVFLHPAQKNMVEHDYTGPARVSGSAGTGKTVVALHRAVHLAKSHPDAKVLLTTFSPALANMLRVKVRRLLAGNPRIGERLEVDDINQIGLRLYEAMLGKTSIAKAEEVASLIQSASTEVPGHRFSQHFLETEWTEIIDAWQIRTWDEYRDVARLGRKTRLPEAQRSVIWQIFSMVMSQLGQSGKKTYSAVFHELAERIATRNHPPYDYCVVDEAQDVSVAQLKFLSAIGRDKPNSLFFAGDLGQRIFQIPFSWRSLEVDIRGRCRTLNINYRTSHQIRIQADRLLGVEIADVDGIVEDRSKTVSVFNGPPPEVRVLTDETEEATYAADWLKRIKDAGVQPNEIGLFVRSPKQLDRAFGALKLASQEYAVLDERVQSGSGKVAVSTMHLAKGLEFRAVAVMACDDEVIPSQERMESVTDQSDLEEVYNTERHLLYVACTRARDFLLVTSSGDASEFLDDLNIRR
jgi:superfamily I DNA/RNA helicase/mRNA-degrading endonuclease RelE of RelBE toxin-antitoxin system